MRFILDTNLLSETTKAVPTAAAVAWLRTHQDECALSVISLGELRFGVERLPEGRRRRQLERHLGFLIEDFGERILEITEGVMKEWGRYMARVERHAGRRPPQFDSLIAATAIHHGLSVATANEKDFPLVSVVNPFSG